MVLNAPWSLMLLATLKDINTISEGSNKKNGQDLLNSLKIKNKMADSKGRPRAVLPWNEIKESCRDLPWRHVSVGVSVTGVCDKRRELIDTQPGSCRAGKGNRYLGSH